MPGITREEVAHLARLSRLELKDEELDHFAEQLDVIIGAVARVSGVTSISSLPLCAPSVKASTANLARIGPWRESY